MAEIHLGPTICATIAWGCSLNMIVSGAVAAKEGWNVPSVALMSAPRILGKIGMFISMVLVTFAAGWWGLLIAHAGGMLFGGISTAILRESTQPFSLFLGIAASLASGIWVFMAQ